MKVIVVDDSEIVRKRIDNMLSKLEGVENVFVVSSRNEAITMLGKRKLDVAIIDIHLPEGSGIELLKYIKKYFLNMKVIMLCNSALIQYRKICYESGADFFFDKSSEFEEVSKLLLRISDTKPQNST